jgi:hypothetical protein
VYYMHSCFQASSLWLSSIRIFFFFFLFTFVFFFFAPL